MKARALIADADGRLVIDGGDLPVQPHAFALLVPEAHRASSATLAAMVNSEVQHILSEGYEMARNIVLAHDDQLTSLAHALMTHEQLDRTQLEELLQKEGWAEF